jgi:hypothetical protein
MDFAKGCYPDRVTMRAHKWLINSLIAHVPFMLLKIINHMLKVGVVCCTNAAALNGFEIYCGTDRDAFR